MPNPINLSPHYFLERNPGIDVNRIIAVAIDNSVVNIENWEVEQVYSNYGNWYYEIIDDKSFRVKDTQDNFFREQGEYYAVFRISDTATPDEYRTYLYASQSPPEAGGVPIRFAEGDEVITITYVPAFIERTLLSDTYPITSIETEVVYTSDSGRNFVNVVIEGNKVLCFPTESFISYDRFTVIDVKVLVSLGGLTSRVYVKQIKILQRALDVLEPVSYSASLTPTPSITPTPTPSPSITPSPSPILGSRTIDAGNNFYVQSGHVDADIDVTTTTDWQIKLNYSRLGNWRATKLSSTQFNLQSTDIELFENEGDNYGIFELFDNSGYKTFFVATHPAKNNTIRFSEIAVHTDRDSLLALNSSAISLVKELESDNTLEDVSYIVEYNSELTNWFSLEIINNEINIDVEALSGDSDRIASIAISAFDKIGNSKVGGVVHLVLLQRAGVVVPLDPLDPIYFTNTKALGGVTEITENVVFGGVTSDEIDKFYLPTGSSLSNVVGGDIEMIADEFARDIVVESRFSWIRRIRFKVTTLTATSGDVFLTVGSNSGEDARSARIPVYYEVEGRRSEPAYITINQVAPPKPEALYFSNPKNSGGVQSITVSISRFGADDQYVDFFYMPTNTLNLRDVVGGELRSITGGFAKDITIPSRISWITRITFISSVVNNNPASSGTIDIWVNENTGRGRTERIPVYYEQNGRQSDPAYIEVTQAEFPLPTIAAFTAQQSAQLGANGGTRSIAVSAQNANNVTFNTDDFPEWLEDSTVSGSVLTLIWKATNLGTSRSFDIIVTATNIRDTVTRTLSITQVKAPAPTILLRVGNSGAFSESVTIRNRNISRGNSVTIWVIVTNAGLGNITFGTSNNYNSNSIPVTGLPPDAWESSTATTGSFTLSRIDQGGLGAPAGTITLTVTRGTQTDTATITFRR